MFVELIDNGSLAALLDSFGSLLIILFGGAIGLTLAVALAARIAAVPLLEARARAGGGGSGEGRLEFDR
jgi:ribulose 1,5-bisphosphate synthetase/thiazole synthase